MVRKLLAFFVSIQLALNGDDLSEDINRFTFALSQDMQEKKQENCALSPLAIFNNLSMLWIGAKGKTKQEIKNALHISTSNETSFLQAVQKLQYSLISKSEEYTLQIANGLFANKGTLFSPVFLHAVQENFDPKVQALDFSHPESALESINRWVSAKTQDHIPTLLKEGEIDAKTRMVVASTLFFEGTWSHPFHPENTKLASFHPNPKKTVELPTMHQVGYFDYSESEDYDFAWLPFKRQSTNQPQLECLLALPKSTHAETMTFSYEDFIKLGNQREKKLLSLSLPKFCYSHRMDLKKALQKLGMVKAFSMQADFSAINQMHDLYLSHVFHEVFISLNENGVTAAAATGSTVGIKAGPSKENPISFTVNRPFVFLIVDRHAKTILFMGHVNLPDSKGCYNE